MCVFVLQLVKMLNMNEFIKNMLGTPLIVLFVFSLVDLDKLTLAYIEY